MHLKNWFTLFIIRLWKQVARIKAESTLVGVLLRQLSWMIIKTWKVKMFQPVAVNSNSRISPWIHQMIASFLFPLSFNSACPNSVHAWLLSESEIRFNFSYFILVFRFLQPPKKRALQLEGVIKCVSTNNWWTNNWSFCEYKSVCLNINKTNILAIKCVPFQYKQWSECRTMYKICF